MGKEQVLRQPAQQAFLCGLGALKNEDQESKTARKMAQVKHFIFWFSFNFSRDQNRKSPSMVSFFSETKRKRLRYADESFGSTDVDHKQSKLLLTAIYIRKCLKGDSLGKIHVLSGGYCINYRKQNQFTQTWILKNETHDVKSSVKQETLDLNGYSKSLAGLSDNLSFQGRIQTAKQSNSSSTREQSNKMSGTRLKTESETKGRR